MDEWKRDFKAAAILIALTIFGLPIMLMLTETWCRFVFGLGQ